MPVTELLIKLEARTDALLDRFHNAQEIIETLESRIEELESTAAKNADAADAQAELERQKEGYSERIGKMLEAIDSALEATTEEVAEEKPKAETKVKQKTVKA